MKRSSLTIPSGVGKGIIAFWHQRIFLVVSYARRFRGIYPGRNDQPKSGWGFDRRCRPAAELPPRPRFELPRRPRGACRDGRGAWFIRWPFMPWTVRKAPGGLIKAGIIRMAQLSGAPIIPVYISVNRAWILRSWDRFPHPETLSTVWVRWDDEPILFRRRSTTIR